MDWTEILVRAAGVGLTIGIIAYIQSATQKFIESDIEGKTILRPHRSFQVLGIISILMAIFFIIGFIIEPDWFMFFIMLAMLGLFGVLGIICLLTYKNHLVIFDDENLTVFDIRGNKETILWTEIINAKFHNFSGYIVLKTSNKTLKISSYIVGITAFGYAFQTFTKWNAKDININLV